LLRWLGSLLAIVFVPAVFALLPMRWRWLHLLPVEGVLGRLMAGLLVGYLNIQGAWIVAGVLAAAGLYFASAVSFWVVKEAVEDRWRHATLLNDRWHHWREVRAEQNAERDAEYGPEPDGAPAAAEAEFRPGRDPSLPARPVAFRGGSARGCRDRPAQHLGARGRAEFVACRPDFTLGTESARGRPRGRIRGMGDIGSQQRQPAGSAGPTRAFACCRAAVGASRRPAA
jgi:hypothetical protein